MSAAIKKLERLYFGEIEEAIDTPNLIEIQLDSYKDFLQQEVAPDDRAPNGLQSVFQEVFPIQSYDEKFTLNFVKYDVGEPKLTSLEALRDGESFSAPLYVTFALTDETGTKEERVYMGEIPMMTRRGTFVINGAERVVVSQLHRSPGVCFETNQHLNGKTLYGFRIIPDRGSWMEVQFDTNDLLYVYLDRRRRRRKFLATTFLRAIGFPTDEDIIRQFYDIDKLKIDPSIDEAELADKVIFNDIMDGDMVVAKAYEPLTLATITQLHGLGIKTVPVVTASHDDLLIKSLKKDPASDEEEALKDIYRRLRPGDPPTVANARALLKRLFFDPKKYDLTRVGRYKINQKLGLDVDENERVVTSDDFITSMAYLFELRRGEGVLDDIDHLGSRRIRAVGELLANQCRVGLARTERLVKERMTLFDINLDGMTPSKLVNPKALAAVVRDFFGRSQLSQFMDQINPLSELTHKRRLSALGPGGLNRDRAGFEVRDVHPSHYGRICPIETPEGPNIGLINSTELLRPDQRVRLHRDALPQSQERKISQEDRLPHGRPGGNYLIAQANVDRQEGAFPQRAHHGAASRRVHRRGPRGTTWTSRPSSSSPSPPSLIPFLEHDDANRALMGSNMQRQGVPLLVSDAPLVGTGIEGRSPATPAPWWWRGGRQSSPRPLRKCGHHRRWQASLFRGAVPQRTPKLKSDRKRALRLPAAQVHALQRRDLHQPEADRQPGPKNQGRPDSRRRSQHRGRRTRARTQRPRRLHAMERLQLRGRHRDLRAHRVKEDVYTSIHVDEFPSAPATPSSVRKKSPATSPTSAKKPCAISVPTVSSASAPRSNPATSSSAKSRPKSETELAPGRATAARHLRRKSRRREGHLPARSLRLHRHRHGRPRILARSRTATEEKNRSRGTQEAAQKDQRRAQANASDRAHRRAHREALDILLGEKIPLDVINGETGEIVIPANRKITKTLLRKLASVHAHIEIDPHPSATRSSKSSNSFESRFTELDTDRERSSTYRIRGRCRSRESSSKSKSTSQAKRKLSVGDKMAGRHGNKGVVATIVPEEDMPFLHDGTPVDICLNPLGVPSRMNVGQVLETHLGVAAKALGFKVATPVFDGIKESNLESCQKPKMDLKMVGGGEKARERKKGPKPPAHDR